MFSRRSATTSSIRRQARRDAFKKRASRLRASATRFGRRHASKLPLWFALTAAAPASSFALDRGMWVWQTTDILENTNSARQTLFNFCAAPHGTAAITSTVPASQPVNVLYFYCHSYINGTAAQKSKLYSFISDAHAHGIKVEFLDGAEDWATTGKVYGERYIDYAIQFNAAAASATQKFDAIQLDIEPYLLPGWFTQSTWDGFTGFLTDAKTKIKASGQALPLGVCIPRWYESNPGPAYLEQVQTITDYVAIMDYVTSNTAIVADVQTEMNNAARLGKKVVVGVETMVVTPASSTFNALGYGNMEIALAGVKAQYASNTAFAGTAVHHYTTYAALSQWGTAGAPAGATATTISTTGAIPVPTTTATATTTVVRRKTS